MAEQQSDILGTLKGGLGLASKLAGRGVEEVSGLFKKSDEDTRKVLTGLYWQRGPWGSELGLIPQCEYFEVQQSTASFAGSMVQRFTVSKAERLFMQACADLVSADGTAAIAGLRECVAKDTQFTDGYFLLGCLQMELGVSFEASMYFQKALLCQQGLGSKLKKYLPSFRMAIPVTPNSVLALYPDLSGLNILLALSYRCAGNPANALSTLEQLLSIMPKDPTVMFFLGVMRLELGRYSEVLEQYSDLMPDSTLQICNVLLSAYACQALGDYSTASDLYNQAMARDDIDPITRLDLRYALGSAQKRLVGEMSSQATVQGVLSECPNYVPFFERLGINTGASPISVTAEVAPLSAAYQAPATPSPAPAAYQAPAAPSPAPVAYQAPATPSPAPVAYQAPAAPSPAPAAYQAPATPSPAPAAYQVPAAPSPAPVNSGAGVGNATNIDLSAPIPALPVAAVPQPQPLQPGQARLICEKLQLNLLLDTQTVTVGRENSRVTIAADDSVSRSHARIYYHDQRFVLEDLGSTNGTWLNGYRLTPHQNAELHHGDQIIFGKTNFKIS